MTASNRYQHSFAQLEAKNQAAFVPFVTIGDPNLKLSQKIIETLIENGADALELGIPFSDPLADGPVIQQANIRALNSHVTPDSCFELITQIRTKYPDIPIGLLLYANLVYSNGIDNFYSKAQKAGVDSVLIADVPVEASAEFRESAKAHDIAPIFIAPPNGDEETLSKVSQYSEGYTYLLSRAGVTGTDNKASMPLENILTSLNQHDAPPPILGFGISQPEQVREAIKSGAAGAISGSATVKIISANLSKPDIMLNKLAKFTQQMKAATIKD
ncbi:tryptophan synthase subunit alpha [Parashewanella spongiae]|uniref:Tryptophan synthase alpha chain n=1 Tax=Parashewanella spongiae TaxID=342950 RepID=A0A3A6TTE0_9GAMM|nr:tryptophan synthase subunit alpha [Parashewanella spongiae]MCL1076743.1 tryptophan synthase subunit alpha [Parashewanella spongiae]RJY19484.1 tryptophan synthase subunit alpha [Parashewanella spongiae]